MEWVFVGKHLPEHSIKRRTQDELNKQLVQAKDKRQHNPKIILKKLSIIGYLCHDMIR